MINPLKLAGQGITYLGLGAMFVMAVVGTISIDLVILMAISKEFNRHGRHGGNGFLTGYLWGTMFSNRHSDSYYGNVGVALLISPLTTGIAILLSVLLGVPEIGIALTVGWIGAFAIVGAGFALHVIGDILEAAFSAVLSSVGSASSNTYSAVSSMLPASTASQPRAQVQYAYAVQPPAPQVRAYSIDEVRQTQYGSAQSANSGTFFQGAAVQATAPSMSPVKTSSSDSQDPCAASAAP